MREIPRRKEYVEVTVRINEDGTNVTQDFVDYVRPLIQGDDPCILVGGLPRHLHLPADQE